MVNPGFHFATKEGSVIHWAIRRNCSVTPAQLMSVFLSLGGVSLVISLFFWFQGATLVMPFAAVELVALGCAFVMYAKHSTDGEYISLESGRLVVRVEYGGKLETAEFQRAWVKVAPLSDDSSLIELSGQGQSVKIGRYIRSELRPMLAKEIRSALGSA
jgi:uncharacterized membrane protein